MFRKTIIRSTYSPALAGELSVLARRLKTEEAKRQVGLIFIALAIIIQLFSVMIPPESANAGSSSDTIEGGFGTLRDYLEYYDRDTHSIKSLLSSLGISRSDILNTKLTTFTPSPQLSYWKMMNRGDFDNIPYAFMRPDGTLGTAYHHPFSLEASHSHGASDYTALPAYAGSSPAAGWFALLKSSGDLVTRLSVSDCHQDIAALTKPSASITLMNIQQCPGKLSSALSARNLTDGASATSRQAQASDRIIYSLVVKNDDIFTITTPLSIGLTDVLEYANIMDKGGGVFTPDTKTLTWDNVTIPPGDTASRNFVVRLLSPIPATAIGQYDQSSYDCVMSSSFGETLRVPIACPLPKAIERVADELPPLSLRNNLIFAGSLALSAVYFYIRSRQLRTELRLIRHNYQGSL